MSEIGKNTPLELGVLEKVGVTTIKKLKAAGLVTLLQIAVTPPFEIIRLTGMGIETAQKVSSLAQKAISTYKTARELYDERKETLRKIKTGSEALDKLLQGGIETGVISELTGGYGVGKTQICFTVAVLVQQPEEEGGLNAKAIAIDTEGTFESIRVAQIAESREYDVQQTLQNILVTRAYNSDHLALLVRTLPEVLQKDKYGLVIVDSLASHFRSEFLGREMLPQRQGKLGSILSNLLRVAESFNVAVIVTNQAQANPTQWGNPNRPALGHIMAHAGTLRLWLRKGKKMTRIAQVLDSPYLPEGEAPFQISNMGISDIE